MATTGELVTTDRDSRFHQEMKSLGLQQVESLQEMKSLLKILVESQVSTQHQLSQIVNNIGGTTTGINYKNDDEKQKAALNPSAAAAAAASSINPLDQPALAATLLNMERPSTVDENEEITQVIPENQKVTEVVPDDHNDRIEESAQDGGQVMSKESLDGYEDLYKAAIDSDWKGASNFLMKNTDAITKVIATDSRTVLHVAMIQGNLMFIEEIVKLMPPEILECKTRISGYTALHYAAMYGHVGAAKLLVNKNRNLTQIEDKFRRIPLFLALISVTGRQRGTVEYLYSVTRHEHPSPFSGNQGDSLLRHTIDAGFYGIASSLVKRFPELVIDQTKKVQTSAMNNMAERPFAFASGAKHTFWQRRIYSLAKVDINAAYEFDNQPIKKSSEENLPQILEDTNGDDENPVEKSSEENLPQILEETNGDEENPVERLFKGSRADGKGPPENLENTRGKAKRSKWETFGEYLGFIILIPLIVPFIVSIIIYEFIKAFFGALMDESPDESHPQSLEVDNGDEETPPEKSKWITVGEYVGFILLPIFAVPFLICLMIELFFGFLVRFITAVTRIKQVREQLYGDKVKHKQAKALVKTIFTTIKERKNKVEVINFFERSDIMKMAIRHGSVEIVDVCIKMFPYLIWTQMGGQNMMQMAIAERNETILDLLCKESGKNKIDLVSGCDDKDNTILHYAAKLAPAAQLNSVSGAYLQMQREKQWFKGVENMIPEKDRFKKNENGDTAHNIFTKEHAELKESGEKWLKDTSGSCMVVAALIATVAFTSTFTVPGGNISDTNSSSKIGTPVFLKKNSFMVFAVADALALFSSVTSVLMFLAIYTSRYAEADFLKSLPNKLIIGLATMFISMASVLVAFSASLFIVLGERFSWVIIPIVVFSCVPVTLFGWLQLPLLTDMIRSTYWGSLFREHTYISSQQLNSKEEIQYNKLVTFVDGFENYLGKLVSKKFHNVERIDESNTEIAKDEKRLILRRRLIKR